MIMMTGSKLRTVLPLSVIAFLFACDNNNNSRMCQAFTTPIVASSSTTRQRPISQYAPGAPLFESSSSDDTTSTSSTNNNNNDEAQKLRDRAAALRAEIAGLQGKTVEEVETEFRTKKESESQRRQTQDQVSAERKAQAVEDRKTDGSFLQVPSTFDDMVRQAARAVERAFYDGKTRQTVRFNLAGEKQSAVEENNEWPGGTKQMYREAGGPLTAALLREVRAPTKNVDEFNGQRSLAPEIKNQVIWDFDGTALWTAEAKEGGSADVQALVFPNTDTKYLNDIAEMSDAMGPRLFLLINPFWRNIDSWSFNLLAPNAKQKAQTTIFDQGYDETYSLMVFMVRGEKCAAIKAYPYDWQLFAFREDENNPNMAESVIRLGTIKDEPTSAVVTELINARPEFQETKTMRQMKKLF
jgi:hypothetical protein